MKIFKQLILSLSFIVWTIAFANAQEIQVNSWKEKVVVLEDSIFYYQLDSLAISSGSLKVFSPKKGQIPPYSFKDNGLLFKDSIGFKQNVGDSILVKFRVFPFRYRLKFNHLDTTLLQSKEKAIYIGYDYSAEPISTKLIQETGIDYDGSFSRGFSLGNSQSLLLNSNFNMQMSGDIGEGIRIKAAISDDNIPIQPEGNTRLLQEFDKVFIQVSKDKSHLTAGDYELNRPKSYFINYFKQVQGLSAYYQADKDEGLGFKSRTSFAISRAKFNRVQLDVVEANQGPYKLRGANGERFIIIEAGSEKIYEDGRLLVRGQDQDYIISYDRAEIIFTEKKLITKDSRIIAEYEYVDRSYLRTMYAAEAEYSFKKLDINFNYYSQQDSRSVSQDGDIDSLDLMILTESGDDLTRARRTGIRLLEGDFDETAIRYKLTQDSVLIYSTDLDSALYIASFTEVAFGEGDYIIDNEISANGRVYSYVGAGLGSYIAEIQLVAPQKSQILSLGANYRPTDKTNIVTEISLSDNDLNRFSLLDNEDNQGLAAYIKIDHLLKLGKKDANLLKPFFTIEQTQANFRALNPYRAVEFTRDWNLKSQNSLHDEQLISAGFNLSNSNKTNLTYRFSAYDQKSSYEGQKHDLNYKINALGFEFTSQSSMLISQDSVEKTKFFRPILGVSRFLGKKDNPWKIGYVYEAESNERRDPNSDSLATNSLAFNVHRYFLQSPNYKKFKTSLAFENRFDEGNKDDDFTAFANAKDFIAGLKWVPSKDYLFNIDFTYRDLSVVDQSLADLNNVKQKRSYLGQMDYVINAFNGFLKSTSSYNIGSGQQAKVEFDYQEVQPGEGNYDWIDVNMDGIQQLGEFRLSEFQDTSRFIQVPLFNNEFIQTNNAGINQSLRLNGKNLFKKKKAQKKGKEENKPSPEEKKPNPTNRVSSKPSQRLRKKKFIKKFVSALSTVSTVRINKKVESDDGNYNPLDFSLSDTTIVAYNSFINNTLFINRGNPRWDSQIGQRQTQSRIAQISSIESRGLNEFFARLRLGLNKRIDFILNLKQGSKFGTSEAANASAQITERNFDIDFRSIKPEINFRPSDKFRIIGKYERQKKSQQILFEESLQSDDFTIELTWRNATKSNWNSAFSFVNVQFEGDDLNSFVAFELLEGLKNGNNYIWRTSFTRRISNNVDFILNYEGRKTGDNRPIHTARAQVKATF